MHKNPAPIIAAAGRYLGQVAAAEAVRRAPEIKAGIRAKLHGKFPRLVRANPDEEVEELTELSDAPSGGCLFGPELGLPEDEYGDEDELRSNPASPEERETYCAKFRRGLESLVAPKVGGKHALVQTQWGWLRLKGENAKVMYPIFAMESGWGCSSTARCPFSGTHPRKAGYPQCYAQKLETAYKNTELANDYQQEVVAQMLRHGTTSDFADIAHRLAKTAERLGAKRWARGERKVLRINDTGDVPQSEQRPPLSAEDDVLFQRACEFLALLCHELHDHGFDVYLYTKHFSSKLRALHAIKHLVVVESEKDFAVANETRVKVAGKLVKTGEWTFAKTGAAAPSPESGAPYCEGYCGVQPQWESVPDKDAEGKVKHRLTKGGKSVVVTKKAPPKQKGPCYLCVDLKKVPVIIEGH